MERSDFAKNLKKVNIQVSELFKNLKETDDRKTIEILVTQLANDVYIAGLTDGQNDKSE